MSAMPNSEYCDHDEISVDIIQLKMDINDILEQKAEGEREKVYVYYDNSDFFVDLLGEDVFKFKNHKHRNEHKIINIINLNEVTQEHVDILLKYLDYIKIVEEN